MKISILTASFNPGQALGDCLASVAGQDQPVGTEVDHFVLDGGSTDGTVDALRAWANAATGRRYRSQPDGGFYEALNSGLQVVDGDIVGILNADDFYFDPLVIARVAEAFLDPGVEGVYGDLVYGEGGAGGKVGKWEGGKVGSLREGEFRIRRYWKSGSYGIGDFRWGWMPPHPTIFVRRHVYERYGEFRTDFGSAADYEWILRVMVRNRVPFQYIPHVQVAMRLGGMSNSSVSARLAANASDRRAWSENGLRPYPWTFVMKPLRKLPQWIARFTRS